MLAALAIAAALAAAGCGNPGGDLMAIEVTEPSGGEPTRLVVTDDGRGRCDDGKLQRLSSERLLEAREVHRDLGDLFDRHATFQPDRPGRRLYKALSRDGNVTWTEGASPAPPEIAKATLLALNLQRDLCPHVAGG
jgi:hypothetical protein